jgi:hypothetical protein
LASSLRCRSSWASLSAAKLCSLPRCNDSRYLESDYWHQVGFIGLELCTPVKRSTW